MSEVGRKPGDDEEEPEWDLGPDADADAAAEPTVVTRAVRSDAPPHWEEIDQGHGARVEVTILKEDSKAVDWSGDFLILAIAEDGALLSSVEGQKFTAALANKCKLRLKIPGKPDLAIDGFIDQLSATSGTYKIKVNFRNVTTEQTSQLREAIEFLKTEAPEKPAIRKPRSWVRRAVLGAVAGTALAAAAVTAYITASSSDSDSPERTTVSAATPEPLIPLVPLEPLRPPPTTENAPVPTSEQLPGGVAMPDPIPTEESPEPQPKKGKLVSGCEVEYHPKRDTHSVTCDVTKEKKVKPRVAWRKGNYADFFDADISFELDGETCKSDAPMLIIAKENGRMERMTFTCAAPQQ